MTPEPLRLVSDAEIVETPQENASPPVDILSEASIVDLYAKNTDFCRRLKIAEARAAAAEARAEAAEAEKKQMATLLPKRSRFMSFVKAGALLCAGTYLALENAVKDVEIGYLVKVDSILINYMKTSDQRLDRIEQGGVVLVLPPTNDEFSPDPRKMGEKEKAPTLPQDTIRISPLPLMSQVAHNRPMLIAN